LKTCPFRKRLLIEFEVFVSKIAKKVFYRVIILIRGFVVKNYKKIKIYVIKLFQQY